MQESAHFRQPIPVHDPIIEKKIHHTYRLQFLKDVVLARALDDSTFNVLNSCILFNQNDILAHLQNDERYMQDVTRLFLSGPTTDDNAIKMEVDQPDGKSTKTPPDHPSPALPPPPPNVVSAEWSEKTDPEITQRQKEVLLLIQQLCIMGKNVQLPARMQLFRMLVDRGVLHALHWALTFPETTQEGQQVIAIAGEVLMTLLDHDINGVREQTVRQFEYFALTKAKDQSLLSLLCELMVKSKDLVVQTLVGDALRMMLELPTPGSDEPVVRGHDSVWYTFVDVVSATGKTVLSPEGRGQDREVFRVILQAMHPRSRTAHSRYAYAQPGWWCAAFLRGNDSFSDRHLVRLAYWPHAGEDEPLSIFMRFAIYLCSPTLFPQPLLHAHLEHRRPRRHPPPQQG
jgi:hypothetical protein